MSMRRPTHSQSILPSSTVVSPTSLHFLNQKQCRLNLDCMPAGQPSFPNLEVQGDEAVATEAMYLHTSALNMTKSRRHLTPCFRIAYSREIRHSRYAHPPPHAYCATSGVLWSEIELGHTSRSISQRTLRAHRVGDWTSSTQFPPGSATTTCPASERNARLAISSVR